MDISIIVPVYNCENYVARAIESALKQDVLEKEIILIDDGSTDGSPNILEEYAKRYDCIKVIHQENRGLSPARDRGLDAATGTWIAFLDGDDALEENALSDMLFLGNQMEADLVVGRRKRVSTFGSSDPSRRKKLSAQPVIDKFDENLLYAFVVYDKIYRRSVIEEHHLRFRDFKRSEDGVFVFSFLKVCGRIVGYPKVAYHYYRNLPFEFLSIVSRPSTESLHDFERCIEEIRSVIQDDWPMPLQQELENRVLKVNLIDEYYRVLWLLSPETWNLLMEICEGYRRKLTPSQWEELCTINSDLELGETLKTKEEFLEHPLVSVIVPPGLTEEKLQMFLCTLYAQKCPNFQVVLDGCYRKILPKEYRTKENLLLGNPASRSFLGLVSRNQTLAKKLDNKYLAENESLLALVSRSKGRFIQIIDACALHDENALKRMAKHLLKEEETDFLSARPMYYENGTKAYIEKLDTGFTKRGLKVAAENPDRRKTFNKRDHYLFNKLFRREALMKILEQLGEKATSKAICKEGFQNLSYERLGKIVIGVSGDFTPKEESKKKNPIEAGEPESYALGQPEEVYKLENPDSFGNPSAVTTARAEMEQRYPVLNGKKLVLFAPGFHFWISRELGYDFKYFNPVEVKDLLGEGYVLGLFWKDRPQSVLEGNMMEQSRLAIDAFDVDLSGEARPDQVLMATDLLITDYTGLGKPFGKLHRPVMYYPFDFNTYLLRNKAMLEQEGRTHYWESARIPETVDLERMAFNQQELVEALRRELETK